MLGVIILSLLVTNIHAVGIFAVQQEMGLAIDPQVNPHVQETLLKDVFQKLDVDEDGVLSKTEARSMTFGMYTMFATLVKNDDGIVTKESFAEHAVGVDLEDFGDDITHEQCNEEDALVSATTDDLWFSIAGEEEELSAEEFAERMWDTSEDDESIMTLDDFLDRSQHVKQKFTSANEGTDTTEAELPTHFVKLDDYTESHNEKCVATKADRRRLCPQCIIAVAAVVAEWAVISAALAGIECLIQEAVWHIHGQKKWDPNAWYGATPAWIMNSMFEGGCSSFSTIFHDFIFSMGSFLLGAAWAKIAEYFTAVGLAVAGGVPAAAGPAPAVIGAAFPGRRLMQEATTTTHGWPMHSVNGGTVNPVWDVSTLGTDLAPGEWDGFAPTSLENCASEAAHRGVPFFAWTGQVYGGYCKVLKKGIYSPNLNTNQGYGYKLYEPNYGTVNCRLTIDDHLISVKYDGIDVPVSGDKNRWDVVKTFSFTRKAGAVLEIVGKEHNNVNGRGCAVSGMLLECDSGLTSNTNDWHTHGSADGVNWIPHSHACQSSSGFHSQGQTPNAQKIWAGNGMRFAKFMTIPVYFTELTFKGATGPRAILMLSEYVGWVVHQVGAAIDATMHFASMISSLIPGILPGIPVGLPGIGGAIGGILG